MAKVMRMGADRTAHKMWMSGLGRALSDLLFTRWMRSIPLALMACALVVAGCATWEPATPPTHNQPPALTVAVMGASDAWGIGTHDPDKINWPALLAEDLPQSAHMTNLGAPGATLAQARRSELPVVLGVRPDVVVIWLAVNDIIDNVPLDVYSSELRQILATIHQQSPQTHVFVGNVPDLTQVPYFAYRDQGSLRTQVGAWNGAISQACDATGAILVDIFSVWGQFGEHPDYLSGDGLHPSDRGAEALASLFSVAITQSLHRTS